MEKDELEDFIRNQQAQLHAVHIKLDEIMQDQKQILATLMKALPSSAVLEDIDSFLPSPAKSVDELQALNNLLQNNKSLHSKMVSISIMFLEKNRYDKVGPVMLN